MTFMKITSSLYSLIRLTSPSIPFPRLVNCSYIHHTARSLEYVCFKNTCNNIEAYINPLPKLPLMYQISVRHYAKGKDRKKEKGKKKVTLDERVLGEILPVDDIKQEMQRIVEQLKEDYIHTLSLRSAAGSVENLPVHFDGKEYTLQEIAQVARKDSKTVIINMTAFPQAIQAVLKSIQKSGMNLNPQQEGTTLYIPIPKVTTEHREQLAKNAKNLFVQCRDKLKQVQIKYEKKLKNDTSLPQDSVFNGQQQLTALAGSYIDTANSMLEIKNKELMGK